MANTGAGSDHSRPTELKPGDRVHHAKFGDGMVVNAVATRTDHEVTVAFGRGIGVKRLLVSLAPLEKL
jgi:DNA helicase-2/ATP-dependent DNA helicase PcrA